MDFTVVIVGTFYTLSNIKYIFGFAKRFMFDLATLCPDKCNCDYSERSPAWFFMLLFVNFPEMKEKDR